jgi:hypothetical protein
MKKFILFFLSLILFLPLFYINNIFSNSAKNNVYNSTTENKDHFGLTLKPGHLDLKLIPGKIKNVSFQIRNDYNTSTTFKLYISPYSLIDEYYNPDYSAQNKWTLITKWINLKKKKIFLKANSTTNVNFQIRVPKNAPAGGQYAVVFSEFKITDTDQGTGVLVSKRMGELVYAKIAGKTIRNTQFTNNKIPFFLTNAPLKTSFKLIDSGNIDYKVESKLKTYNFFNNSLIYESGIRKDRMFPDTTKLIELDWSNNLPTFGLYKVVQNVKYYGQVHEYNKVIFICPILILIIILIALICFILFIKYTIKFVKHKH